MLVWLLGLMLSGLPAKGEADSRREIMLQKLDVLAQVLAHIEEHYVDPIAPTDLVYAAARGAMAALDAHASFMTPDEYRALMDTTEGEYAGIGVDFEIRQGRPWVRAVVDASPAMRAGVAVGDVLLRIDGHDLYGMSYEEVWRRLKGPVGSAVQLCTQGRRHQPLGLALKTHCLTRTWVRVAPLLARYFGDVTYVQVKEFSRHVAQDLQALLQATPVRRGLVLDLRGNPGGLFEEAVDVCDLFLRDGPIVSTLGRDGQILDAPCATRDHTQPDYPLAILIDSDTASAAEIVAGALHDRRRARLFGSRSFGKGSVQSIVDLLDGSGLKMTIGRYQTPVGRAIEGRGVEPDEAVLMKDGKPGHDGSLAAAINYLRAPTL